MSIVAEFFEIRQIAKSQVLIDSNLGITKNVVVGGSSYVNGNLFVKKIVAPLEYQVTEAADIEDSGTWSITGTLTGIRSGDPITITSVVLSGGTLKITQPHKHAFKNAPMHLVGTYEDLHNLAASDCNSSTETASPPLSITDGYKATPPSLEGGRTNMDFPVGSPNGP